MRAREKTTDVRAFDVKRIIVPDGAIADGGAINLEDVFSVSDVPEVPAEPTEQDIVDALVALGLVTQAE